MEISVSSLNFTLPQPYFTSAEVFREELERIFYSHWLCAGREEEIARPGDYIVREIDTESIIIVRDESGEARAFYNVCRHRGARICHEEQGRFAKTILCPYHAWSYALNGRLVGVSESSRMRVFEKEDYPLQAVAVTTWEGFIFINLSPEPKPFEIVFAPVLDRFDDWRLFRLKRAERVVYDVKANWKLVVENYNECYHCPLIHPELNQVSSAKSGANELNEGLILGGYMTFRLNKTSMSLTGQTCAAPIGSVTGEDLERVYFFSIFPNLLLSLHPDYVMFHTLWPQATDRTKIVCEWLFEPETIAQPDFNPGDAVEFWDRTNRQDWRVCEISQLGIRSRAYTPGPYYDWHENLLAEFDRQVLKALGHSSP
jgi:Rieske 2Fe-2S family protein